MKISLRRGVFETNSSSMHSLVVKEGSGWLPKGFLAGETVVLKGYDFGTDRCDYFDWYEKACYLFSYVGNYHDVGLNFSGGRQRILWNEDFRRLKKVIEDYTGAEIDFEESEDSIYLYGIVDYQSIDLPKHIIAKHDRIEKFIFCDNVGLETKRDSYAIADDIYDIDEIGVG